MMPLLRQPKLGRKHIVGTLTAGVIAITAGTASQQGLLPRWEGGGTKVEVAKHLPFDRPGVITVCHGHTNLDDPNLEAGDVYTAAMCRDVLAADLPKYNKQLASCLPKDFMVGDRQHAAMLSFIYNVGKNNFCNSSVGRAFRAGDRKAGCENMGKFTRANGVELRGLHNRRYDKFFGEITWCLSDE